MARQNINVGAAPNDGTGDPLRTAMIKSNDNFIELYEGRDAVTVANFAALPAPDGTNSGERWWVLASTGVWLVNRHNKGAYYSNGTTWSYLGDFPQTASEVTNVPAGSISAVTVQAAINELELGIGNSSAPAGNFSFGDNEPPVYVNSTHTGTLPASPATGLRVGFITGHNLVLLTIARNGELVEGLAENMTVSRKNTSGGFVFAGGAIGWKAFEG